MGIESSADLLFKISADPSNATANVAQFRALMSKDLGAMKAEFAGWAKSVFGDLSSMSGAITAGVAGGLAALALLVAGAVAGAKALWDLGEKAAEFAGEIDDAGHKTGMSAEALSGLRYAAKNADLGFGELTGALVKFEVAITKALDPTSEQAKTFHRFGVSQKEIQAGSRDLLPLLYKTADGFRANADGALKAAAARELFGRGGAVMIEFLNQGAAGMRMFADEAERLGYVLTERDIVAAKMFRLETIALKGAFEGLKLEIGTGVLPVMTEVLVNLEAYLRTAPKVWEEYRKLALVNLVSPFLAQALAARAGLKVWERELAEARERLAARLRAARGEGTGLLAEPEGVKKETQDWRGLSDALEQARMRLAALGPEEGKIAAEGEHLRFELFKLREEFQRLQKEGKLAPEAMAREMAAATKMPAAIAAAERRAMEEEIRKRDEAIVAAALDLQRRLDETEEQTYEHRRSAEEREIEQMRGRLTKQKTLTEENAALLARVARAGQEQIGREQGEAFVGQLKELQASLAEYVTARMTAAERLRWTYEQDLVKFSEVEEAKRKVGQTPEQQIATMQMFALVRGAALKQYETELTVLRNSQGWQGVFGEEFAECLRGNQELSREWAISLHQDLLLPQVAMENLREIGLKAFKDLSHAMGAGIAQAIIYAKSMRQACREAAVAVLEEVAAVCAGKAILAMGEGFLALAQHRWADATAAFKGAALFGIGAMEAAVIGRAIAPREAGAVGAGGVGGGAEVGAGSAGAPGGQERAQPRVQIIIQGHVIGRTGVEELTEIINEAVQGRDVRLVATAVRQATRVIR
jgi:hypothetical protein